MLKQKQKRLKSLICVGTLPYAARFPRSVQRSQLLRQVRLRTGREDPSFSHLLTHWQDHIESRRRETFKEWVIAELLHELSEKGLGPHTRTYAYTYVRVRLGGVTVSLALDIAW